jgi:hypothetical protein
MLNTRQPLSQRFSSMPVTSQARCGSADAQQRITVNTLGELASGIPHDMMRAAHLAAFERRYLVRESVHSIGGTPYRKQAMLAAQSHTKDVRAAVRPASSRERAKNSSLPSTLRATYMVLFLFDTYRTNALRNALGQLDGNRHLRGDRLQRGLDR